MAATRIRMRRISISLLSEVNQVYSIYRDEARGWWPLNGKAIPTAGTASRTVKALEGPQDGRGARNDLPHPTDPNNEVPEGSRAAPDGSEPKECAGALLLVQKELNVFQKDPKGYLKARGRRGLFKDGIA